ncbi:Chromate resistance protein ChrB [Paenibacillus azoreducens]|uniref:Chromate resistance protein ChrB n=1 Tax=Paenibacillus azoreducens TaxID=116718 RepID=UPI0039F5B0CA
MFPIDELHRVNKQRDKEYDEFLEGCNLFLNELENETQKGNFTYHEVEENEADLMKLKRWFRKIEKRDFFKSAHAPLARNQLDHCEIKLAHITDQVYRSEGKIEGEIFHGGS